MKSKTVWSSELGGDLRHNEDTEITKEPMGPVQVRRETKGRGGKTVVVIRNLSQDKLTLQQWCKTLKKKVGAGGSVKDDLSIEIQGECLALICAELQRQGHQVKQVGG